MPTEARQESTIRAKTIVDRLHVSIGVSFGLQAGSRATAREPPLPKACLLIQFASICGAVRGFSHRCAQGVNVCDANFRELSLANRFAKSIASIQFAQAIAHELSAIIARHASHSRKELRESACLRAAAIHRY